MQSKHPSTPPDKYRLILQNVRDFAIFSVDINGRIDEWNPGAERFFGYQEHEILGQPMDVLYVPEDRDEGRAELEKAAAAQTGYSEDERWHLRKDGSRFFVFGMVNAMYDDAGKLCGFIKVARDITPRKLLMDRLVASEAHHRLILDSIQDFAIITLDNTGVIQSWNPGAVTTFGYEEHEVIGKNHSLLFTPEDCCDDKPKQILQLVLADGVHHAEAWAVRKDGARIFLIEVLRTMPNDTPKPDCILMVARDITIRHLTRMNLETTQRELENTRDELERKVEHRTAALQESVQSLEQVLYHVAHDLRAPLRTMEGFSSILVQKFSPKADPETERLTGMISNAAQRMDHLIQDLLVYGRLCNEPVRRERISTEVAVEAAIIQLSNKLRQSAVQVQVLPPLPNVWGDYNVLLQVLIELISNAIAFRALTRTLQLRLYAMPVKRAVRLCVEDNGIGILPEHQERIFWMFERLSHDNSSGTGMGLAIARKGIERMDGRIGVESEPGAGSKFWLELPAADETNL